MLSVTPADQWEEIEHAVQFRDKHTEPIRELYRRYAGRSYRDDWSPKDGPNYVTHEAEYIANTVPNLIYNNPRVEMTGWLPGVDDQIAEALELGCNHWIEAVRFNEKVTQVAYDVLFGWGVTVSTVEVLPGCEGYAEPLPLWPQFHRIPFARFFQDPQGGLDNWRFRGHVWIADKADLMAAVDPYTGEPLFMRDVVATLPEDDATAKALGWGEDKRLVAQRKQVIGYEKFDRETGMIYTLAESASGGSSGGHWIRKPRPWKGHPDGPYTVYGIYTVPDQPYPLSPLAVTSEMVREINLHKQQMAEDAASAKRLIVVDGGDPSLANSVQSAANGSVVKVKNLVPGMVVPIEFGGPQAANANYVEMQLGALREASGMSDLKRGNITGKATATEVAEVAKSDDARTSFMRAQFRACVTRQLEKAVYQMMHFEDVQFPIAVPILDPMGREVGRQAQMFNGGMQAGEDPSMAGRLRVKIEPYSMEHVDSGIKQRRAAQVFEIVSQSVPIIPTTPFVNWEAILDDIGESINQQGMGKRYINFDMLAMMQQQAAMAAQADVPGEEGQPQPGGEAEPQEQAEAQMEAMAGAI